MQISDEEKFESIKRNKEKLITRLKKDSITNNEGCIIASGTKNSGGHIDIRWRDGDLGINKKGESKILGVQAHRLAWIIANNKMPEPGDVVRHKCNNPACINPDHLHIGTRGQNLIDDYKSGNSRRAKLNETKVREIRELYSKGMSSVKIAKKFNISQSSALDAATGKSYEWVK
ncbi:hypothetical protein JCM14469_43410 [Desulfatiferula olefinivorans]